MKSNVQYTWFGKEVMLESSDSVFSKIFSDRFQGYAQEHSKQLLLGNLRISFSREMSAIANPNSIMFGNHLSFYKSTGLIIHNYLSTTTSIEYELEKDDVRSISIRYQASFAFSFVNLLLRGLLERQLFSVVVQDYVEKALLSIVSKKTSGDVLHAASIENDGRVVAFTGLNGSGKSTVAQYFVQHHGWKQFSDNYLLLNDTVAYYNPETARLSGRSLKLLSLAQKNSDKNSFGKTQVFVSSESKSKKLTSTLCDIFILSRAPTYSHTIISRDDAQKQVGTLLVIDHETIKQHPISLFMRSYEGEILSLSNKINYHRVEFSQPKELAETIL